MSIEETGSAVRPISVRLGHRRFPWRPFSGESGRAAILKIQGTLLVVYLGENGPSSASLIVCDSATGGNVMATMHPRRAGPTSSCPPSLIEHHLTRRRAGHSPCISGKPLTPINEGMEKGALV